MNRFIIASLVTLVVMATASFSNARDDEPSPELIKRFANSYMKTLSQLSTRETAHQLASTLIWIEKLQTICPSYYYVNSRNARHRYLLYQGTWDMMFGPGKTSTAIMNQASAKRNKEFNNSASKKEYCEGIKTQGIRTFAWGNLFETD